MASRPRNRRRLPLCLEQLERRLVLDGGISGRLYIDANGHGAPDTGQPGLAGWTVFLDHDPSVKPVTTDSKGNYSFTNLPAATYHVRELPPSGWLQTSPDHDINVGIALVPGVNFANFQEPTISGQVFQDVTGSGTKAAGDTGISGWTVFLDANSNGVLDQGELSTTTDANGNYSLANVGPGSYQVREISPSGWQSTTALPAKIVAQSGVNTTGVDFGNFQKITLSGQVFEDTNGNGVLDPGELGLKAWQVFLDNIGSNGKVLSSQPAKMDTSGNYSLTDLGPGTYQLREIVQPGWLQTTATPAPFVAQSGTNETGLNLGNFRAVRLSGRTYNDLNNDGTDGGGADPGVSGVTIQLYQDTAGTGKFDSSIDTLLGSVVTSTGPAQFAGQYGFANLGPGQYLVIEPQQAGIRQTAPVAPGVYLVQVQSGVAVTKLDFGNLSSPDRIFVAQVYQDLLHRRADGTALDTWAGQFDAGTLTRSQMVQQIERSSEYLTDVVQDLYNSVLRRPADQGGITTWTAFLAQGGTAKQLQTVLYGSGEYLTTRGGGTTDGFLTALYQDVLNRPIDTDGLHTGRQALANGVSRADLAAMILNSREADQDEVQALFLQLLHRPADGGGLTNLTNALLAGASLEQVIVSVTGSREYAQNTGGDANQLYVAHLYRDLLNRDADARGLANFTGLLNSGAATRSQVAQAIMASSEYHAQVVQQLYSTYLNRAPDPAGLAAFTKLLDQGGTDEQVAYQLASSAEYFQQRGGGSNDGFLDALYKDALGRGVDATGRKSWDQLMAGGLTTGQVAAFIFSSGEYQIHLVEGLFQQFLHRIADQHGISTYTGALQAGTRDEAIIAILVTSAEYFVLR